jgi:hypothetical protein
MPSRRLGLLLCAAMALATGAASAAPAKTCRVSRAFNDSGWHVKVVVSNDAGVCAIDVSFLFNGRTGSSRIVPTSGSVSPMPKHGTAKLDFQPLSASVGYAANPGYVGPDSFEMHLLPGVRPWAVEVTVGP